jgi:hypothetical protein
MDPTQVLNQSLCTAVPLPFTWTSSEPRLELIHIFKKNKINECKGYLTLCHSETECDLARFGCSNEAEILLKYLDERLTTFSKILIINIGLHLIQ